AAEDGAGEPAGHRRALPRGRNPNHCRWKIRGVRPAVLRAGHVLLRPASGPACQGHPARALPPGPVADAVRGDAAAALAGDPRPTSVLVGPALPQALRPLLDGAIR